jgi:hypothetical protein
VENGVVQQSLDNDYCTATRCFIVHLLCDAGSEAGNCGSSSCGVPAEGRWVEGFAGEVAPEHAPEGSICSGRNAALITVKYAGGKVNRWPVSERCAALHQDTACRGSIGHKDHWERWEEIDCEDGAVPGLGKADNRLNVEGCPS